MLTARLSSVCRGVLTLEPFSPSSAPGQCPQTCGTREGTSTARDAVQGRYPGGEGERGRGGEGGGGGGGGRR